MSQKSKEKWDRYLNKLLYLKYNPTENLEQSKFEERLEQIRLEIEKLKQPNVPITQEQLFKFSEREDVLFEKFDKRTTEEEEEYRILKSKIEDYGLIVENLIELRYALECLNMFSPEQITDIVSHENAHANKMGTLGINCRGYEIIVFQRENGKEWPMITTIPDDFPSDWDIEKKKKINKEIASASEEYESNCPLSSFDKGVIERFDKN